MLSSTLCQESRPIRHLHQAVLKPHHQLVLQTWETITVMKQDSPLQEQMLVQETHLQL